MILTTSAGMYRVHEHAPRSQTLRVSSVDRQSLQILADGLEMLCGVAVEILPTPLDPDTKFTAQVSRENFAEWVAFEIREYDV